MSMCVDEKRGKSTSLARASWTKTEMDFFCLFNFFVEEGGGGDGRRFNFLRL